MANLTRKLTSKGINVQAVEEHAGVRDRLRGEGLADELGGIDRLRTVADVVERFLQERPAESR